jgi:biotin carboxylase
MNKRKILVLGGSDIQVSAIKKAKAMGYHVVTCGYLPDNPGHKFSDEYYNISTTNKERVLQLAKKLKIDGILAYASDPAALPAAYVAEKLQIPTNSYAAVEIMSRKDLFRSFMEKNNFLTPQAKSVKKYSEAVKFLDNLNKTAIIKPVDSSGSKGIYKVEVGGNFKNKFNDALSFSREEIVIIEEFIEKKGFQIGGDGFLVDGELVFRCFGDIHFSKVNPLLPCSVSVPSLHEPDVLEKVHEKVQKLLSLVGMKIGALNFDIIVDKNDNVYILEIGARNGGNMIPELTELCTGVDMIEYSIKAAMGEDLDNLTMRNEKKFFSHYVVHSVKSGKVKSIHKSEKLKLCLLNEHYNFKVGDHVKKFDSSANRLGIFLLKYNSKKEMLDLISDMENNLVLNIQ